MDNDQLNKMSAEEFGETLKRLQAHAESQAERTFKAGDRKAFELWDYRATQLRSIGHMEAMADRLKK
jgi:hypothetical protein